MRVRRTSGSSTSASPGPSGSPTTSSKRSRRAPTRTCGVELESDLLAATDQLLDDYRVDDGTWARLAEQLDEHQLIELTFVVGTYTCLAMAFNTFGLELDPDLHTVDAPPLPDAPR